jgi:hypothetical protein
MNVIEFNDVELAEMKRLYQSQLLEAESKVAHLKSILGKLSGSVPSEISKSNEVAVIPMNATGIQEDSEPIGLVSESLKDNVKQAYISFIPAEFTKLGRGSKRKKERKSKWSTYILNLLRTKGEPMTVNEIVEHAMKRTANIEAGEPSVRGGISSSLSRLSKEYFRVRTLQVDGRRGRYFCLSVWFDANSKFKGDFGQRFGQLNMNVKDALDASSEED